MTPRPERRAARGLAVALLCGLLLAACAQPAPRSSTRTSSRSAAPVASANAASKPASAKPVPPAASRAAAPGKTAPAAVAAADPDARFKAAIELMKARQFADAQAAFTALSRDYPAFSGPLTNLGILYAQGKQREAAAASFSKAVDANPRNAVALNWLGILYREGGDYPHAVSAYQRALVARPDYAPAVLNLGILYDVFLHRPGDALAAYRQYQKLTGNESLLVAAWIRDLESPPATVTAELFP